MCPSAAHWGQELPPFPAGCSTVLLLLLQTVLVTVYRQLALLECHELRGAINSSRQSYVQKSSRYRLPSVRQSHDLHLRGHQVTL